MNLCANAKDAIPEGGQIVVETRNVEIGRDSRQFHVDVCPGNYVLLSVSDTGAGMDAATLEKIFQPFFTRKEAGKRVGLGLATVYVIIKRHEGFIDVESDPGHGSVFRIYMPYGGSIPGRSEKESQQSRMEEPARILLAEDNRCIREMVAKLSNSWVILCLQPQMEKMRSGSSSRTRRASLWFFWTSSCPELSGPETYRRMAPIEPGLRVILATAYPQEAPALRTLARDGAVVLQKPYSSQLLSQKVKELVKPAV